MSVSLSSEGTIVAIGAPRSDPNGTDSGHVRVYQRDTNVGLGWTQLGANMDGEAAFDNLGSTVSLSSDGTIVAIGASKGGTAHIGRVRVYQRDTNVALGWSQLGADIDGEAAGDNSGWSVSLSSEGTIVAIGAIYNGGNGIKSGHARVYELKSITATVGDVTAADIDNNVPEISGTEANADYNITSLTDPYLLTTGTTAEKKTKRRTFISRLLRINAGLLTGSKRMVMNTSLLGLSNTMTKPKMRILTSTDTTIDMSTLPTDEGIYSELENIGSEITLIAMDLTQIKFVKTSETEYDVFENYVDGTSVVTNVRSEGYEGQYDNITYVVGSLTAQTSSYTLTLNGSNPTYVSRDSNITDYTLSATGTDGNNDDVSGDIVISPTISSIDTSIEGLTYLTYTLDTITVRRAVYVYYPQIPICFPQGTPVLTDQGTIAIEKLNTDYHTVCGNEIVAITQTTAPQKHIVCFERDSLSKNVPSQKTLCSLEHKVCYEGEMIKARNIVDLCENVTFVPYNGETLYNVLLKQYDTMDINNMKCETLHPANIMAKISQMKDGQKKHKIMYELSKIIKENNSLEYQKLYASL